MRDSSERRGFTLVELTVTLAVVAIAAAVVLPLLPHGGALRVHAAADRLAARLSEARARAILRGRPERLALESLLPAGVHIETLEVGGTLRRAAGTIDLASDGDALPVHVTLAADGDARATVLLPPGLSAARVEAP